MIFSFSYHKLFMTSSEGTDIFMARDIIVF